MNQQTQNRLDLHRADSEKITGKPFKRFFCPILHVDEDVELMRGHVINEAFKGSPGAWVVQRKDVDGFYGGYFEGDFELIQHLIKAQKMDYFFNKKLYSGVRPRILIGNQEVPYYIKHKKYRDTPPPEGFNIAILEHNGQKMELCVRASKAELDLNPA